MLNRSLEPPVNRIREIEFLNPDTHTLPGNGVLYCLREVANETARVELIFRAGKITGTNGIPAFTNGLLLSGTSSKSSFQIHEALSSLGAYYSSAIGLEHATVTIHSLRENLFDALRIVLDAISGLTFDQREVEEYLRSQKQQHLVNLEKVSFLAQRTFQKYLFSSDLRLNQVIELADYDETTREAFQTYHQRAYLKGLEKVFLVANLEASSMDNFAHVLSPFCSNDRLDPIEQLQNTAGEFRVEKAGAMQSAIKIGRILFNKKHSDYPDFLVLNTILGDYFGSRLMSNIREDKGFTYGIGSALVELSDDGYFLVSTEVGNTVCNEAVLEIRKEFERLQNKPVPNEELDLVRNYMLGQLLKHADGPYGMMDMFVGTLLQGEELDYYNHLIERIEQCTAERIQDLAQEYLKWENMTVVIAG